MLRPVHCDPDIFLKSADLMRRTKAWVIRDGEAYVQKRLTDIGVPLSGIKRILRKAKRR